MTNRIRGIQNYVARLTPMEAEIRVLVYPEQLTADTEVRGKLVGPRCRYASTVEVAYPMREGGPRNEEQRDFLTLHAIIPEPSFWDAESPHLYQGRVELWQGKELCDEASFSKGLCTFELGNQGLRWNGRPVMLRGVVRDRCTEEEARRLHQAGCNTLLASVDPDSSALWDFADRLGFMMLGRVESMEQAAHARILSSHPSSLGWICSAPPLQDLNAGTVNSMLRTHNFNGMPRVEERYLIGVEITSQQSEPQVPVYPLEFDLELRHEQTLPNPAEIALPVLVMREKEFMSLTREEMESESVGTLGSIYL